MTQEVKDMMGRILDSDGMGYAYLYPRNGSARKEYLISTNPENIVNFIGSHQFDAEKMVITDCLDRLIVDTCGGFLNTCPNQKLCGKLIKLLAPIQMCMEAAKEPLCVDRKQADEYFAWEDEEVTMAEYRMG